MAKSKYEKMEIMLEEIMKESDIEAKIEEMKEELKQAPKGKGNSKEEYRKSIQEDKKRKEELGKKLKFYEAFKNNKDEILNIREYQLSLQVKLDKLEKEKTVAEKLGKYNENLVNESEKIDKELEEIMQKREEIANKLKNKDLSDEERKELLNKDKKLIGEINNNSLKFQVVQNFKSKEVKNQCRDIEEISKDILSTQIKISKCNMIWSSLLKGKDWDQIEVILNTGDFTAKKGTIDKIKQLKDASQIKTGNKVNTKNTPSQGSKNNGVNGVQTNLPGIVKPSFKDRHPRLAKIPFLAKIVDKFNNKADKNKPGNNINANTGTKVLENLEDEKALNYIEKRMEQDEVAMFKSIAKKGFKESMRVDLEQRRAEAKKEAAERESDKFGGKYKIDNNNNGR